MKYPFLLTIYCLLVSLNSFSQNYSCISPETKTYFTNTSGYLLGMRIDSVKTLSGNTVHYPFKTGRVPSPTISYDTVDVKGASWLGAEITERADHFTVIKNHWNDTVFIKNDALLGESWTLYTDSTDISFEATVIAMDTITVANVPDSIKIISIQAIQNNSILQGDSLNDLKFSISKNHGFISAQPFYFFPYYTHPAPFIEINYDYYFSIAIQGFQYRGFKKAITFNRVDYRPIQTHELFNYEVGDIFISNARLGFNTYRYDTRSNTIISKVTNGDTVTYQTKYYKKYWVENNHIPSQQAATGTDNVNYYGYFSVSDSSKMPEEWYNRYLEYYVPMDKGFCYTSDAYGFSVSQMIDNGHFSNFEPTTSRVSYKNGLGRTSYYYSHFPTLELGDANLMGASKNGIFCGTADSILVIEEKPEEIEIASLSIYPIPCSNRLNVESKDLSNSNGRNNLILLQDMAGKKIREWHPLGAKVTLDLTEMNAGVYFLKIHTEKSTFFKKIVVVK